MASWSPDPRWAPAMRLVTPLRVSQQQGKVALRPRAWCHSSSLCTRSIYRSAASHLAYEHGSGQVDIEDFWEGERHVM